MAQDSSNVRVAVTGALSVGATSVAPPTDANATVAGMADLGYVSDDGVTETRDRSTTKLKAWQNADTVREVVTEAGMSYKCRLIETKKETVELFYGSTVDASGRLVIVPAKTGGRRSFMLDVVDGDDFIRAFIAEGEITEVGDQVYASGEAIGYEVTVAAYPSAKILDADGNPGSVVKFYSSLDTTP